MLLRIHRLPGIVRPGEQQPEGGHREVTGEKDENAVSLHSLFFGG